MEEPTHDGSGVVQTFAPSIRFEGSAFVSPENVDCVSIFPIQQTLTWRNETTGQSGRGGIGSSCVAIPIFGLLWNTRWSVPEGLIDLQIGTNRITLTTSDGRGNSGTVTMTIERLNDVSPPVVTNRSPAPDETEVPVNRSLSVVFSEDMLLSSLTDARLTVTDPLGVEVDGFRGYDDHNFIWRFDPNSDLLFSSTYTVRLDGGVEDRFGGNVLGVDLSWSFTTAPNPDVTPPQVTEVSPEPATQCVAPDASIVAGFDEPLDSTTVNTTTVLLMDEGANLVSSTVDYDGVAATLLPDLPLQPGTGYEATLTTGISDLAGNMMTSDFRWNFEVEGATPLGTWTQTSGVNVPAERNEHTAIWTGNEMIVFGGRAWEQSIGSFVDTDSGGRYDPIANSWTATSIANVLPFIGHTAIWTGSEMIVWGGNTSAGARYDPGSDSWQPTSETGAPTARRKHVTVWTGSEMIVWGGVSIGGISLNSGGRYDPGTDSWQPISTTGAPSPRAGAAAVWTGTEFVVWGGAPALGVPLTDGASYNPATDTWTPLPPTDARSSRNMTGVWTGTEVLVWNGGLISVVDSNGFTMREATLRFYDPVTDAWRASANLCEPYMGASGYHAQWTGSRLFVWADSTWGGFFYDPATDDWQSISTTAAPANRSNDASVWAGDRFILWGGQEVIGGLRDTGFVFEE